MDDLKNSITELFPELAADPEMLKEFDSSIRIRSFSKGDYVIDYGDSITHVPLVLEGVLKVMRENEKEQEVLLYFLESGNTCAASFSCCMIKKRSEIKVIADSDCRIAFIPLERVNRWMSSFETWRNFVFKMFEQRMTTMIDTIDQLTFSKLDEHLLHYLEKQAMLKNSVTINISHADIARDLSSSREAISRLLKKFEVQGVLELGRNKITLKQEII